MARSISVGIDLGTAVTRTVVLASQKDGTTEVVATSTVQSKGIRHGYIVSTPDAAETIRKCVALAESEAGVKIRKAIFSIGGISLSADIGVGSTIISKSDGEVSAFDIKTALSVAEESLGLKNRKIIYSSAVGWKLDGKEIPGRPEGLNGVKLEAKVLFITCMSQHLDDIFSAAAEAGIEVLDIVPSSIAASNIALSERQKAVGVMLVNIGAETVSLAVFENNTLIGLTVLPVGSANITNDIAIGFRIQPEEAESLKTGNLISNNFPKKKVDEIIEARLSDIFDLIDGYLKKIRRSGLLPAGVIITGGGAGHVLVEGLSKSMLRLPSRVGGENIMASLKGPNRDASWFVAYGLALYGQSSGGSDTGMRGGTIKGKAKGFVKEFLRQFLP